MHFRRAWLILLACCFVFSVIEITRPIPIEWQVEVSSSVASTAQLYLDSGKGYSEAESITAPVAATRPDQFQQLTFSLPSAAIYSLRFDPLTTAGRVSLKNARITAGHWKAVKFQPSQIVPLNQIRSVISTPTQATVETTEHANDPQVGLNLSGPLPLRRWLAAERVVALGAGNLILLVLGWLIRPRLSVISQWHRRLQARAEQLSTTDFIRFDACALWFYFACFALFLGASLADLNGSSLGMYRIMFGQQPHTVLGTPKLVRADEWAFHTPVIMNQSLRADRFAAVHSALGEHSAALIGCVPIKHISTLFRPQFWAFFVLPIDYAFAVYWQTKALLLLCGVFTWLLLLTRSTFWSIAGALWYFFSAFTQWAYSWASLLPESVGLICLAMVFFCFLTVGRNRTALALSALGWATCVIDFALCAYLPHLIPLFWLAVFFLVSWCIANRSAILRKENALARMAAWGAALLITGVIGAVVHADAKDAIIGIAHTAYPGQRLFSGANTPPALLLSHFLNWTDTEQHVPAQLANISEAAGFLWLAPATTFLAVRLKLSKQQKAALLSLWCVFLFLLAWMLLPVPSGVGRLFALDRTGWTRCLPALGLANIAIVSLCAATDLRRNKGLTAGNALCAAGVFFPLLFILWRTNQSLNSFYKPNELLLGTSLATLFVTLLLCGQTKALAFALVGSQAIAFGLVNPIQRGLKPITENVMFTFFQTHRELFGHKWIYFADGVMAPGFLEAMGCDEYTGMRFLPDIDHFRLFQEKGLNVAALNHSGPLLAHAIERQSRSYVKVIQPGISEWYVSPADPLLRRIGVEYAAFENRPSPSIEAGLIPLRDVPDGTIRLYRLP